MHVQSEGCADERCADRFCEFVQRSNWSASEYASAIRECDRKDRDKCCMLSIVDKPMQQTYTQVALRAQVSWSPVKRLSLSRLVQTTISRAITVVCTGLECDTTCPVKVGADMASEVNTKDRSVTDTALKLNETFPVDGCKGYNCSTRFCRHVGLMANATYRIDDTSGKPVNESALFAKVYPTTGYSIWDGCAKLKRTVPSKPCCLIAETIKPILTTKQENVTIPTQVSRSMQKVVTEVVSRNETVQVRVPRLITTISTVSSRSEQPADVFLLLDGSGSMICRAAGCKYTMENWDLEKEAAIKMIAGMQQNLTNLTAGMAQFSIGSTVQAPLSSDLELVKTQINAQTLMQGGTDFGSPLAQCMDELLTKGQITKNPIRFCVLITDGIPQETSQTAQMYSFCSRNGISNAECTMRNVMYKVKQAGFIVMGVFVGTTGATAQNIAAGQSMIGIYSSCEVALCPLTCGQCSASDPNCFDNEPLLRIKSTVAGQNIDPATGRAAPFFETCAAAKNNPTSLCSKAGSIQPFDVVGQYMNGKSYALPIDLGTVSYGASKYNPQVVFTKNATATSARKIATNHDSTGRCMYYAEASNMQGLVALVGTLVADLVRTVGVTIMNTTTVFENQTVFEVSTQTISVNRTFSYNETISVVFQCFTNCSYDTSLDSVCSEGPGAGLCVGDMEAKYLESSKCCRTERVSRSCKTDKPYDQKIADACPSCNCTDAIKRAACLDNDQYCKVNVSSVYVEYNEVQSGDPAATCKRLAYEANQQCCDRAVQTVTESLPCLTTCVLDTALRDKCETAPTTGGACPFGSTDRIAWDKNSLCCDVVRYQCNYSCVFDTALNNTCFGNAPLLCGGVNEYAGGAN